MGKRFFAPLATDAESSMVAIADNTAFEDRTGLRLPGGRGRAMLFHVGALWRLSELCWLHSFIGSRASQPVSVASLRTGSPSNSAARTATRP